MPELQSPGAGATVATAATVAIDATVATVAIDTTVATAAIGTTVATDATAAIDATVAIVNTAAIANTGCCQVAAVLAPPSVLPPRHPVVTGTTARSLAHGARAPLGLAAPRRACKKNSPAALTAQNRAGRAASRAVVRGPSKRLAGSSPLRHVHACARFIHINMTI